MPRSGYLLCSLLALMLIYPWILGNLADQLLFELASTVVTAIGVYTLATSPFLRRLGSGLALAFIAVNLLAALTHSHQLIVFGLLLALALYAVVIVGLIDSFRRHERVSRDTLCSALSVYLLIGFFFGAVYILINLLVPHSFTGTLHKGVLGELNVADMIYFSFTVLTTAGFGDITPVSHQARFVAVYEEIIGIVYTTVIIARLVGMYSHDKD